MGKMVVKMSEKGRRAASQSDAETKGERMPPVSSIYDGYRKSARQVIPSRYLDLDCTGNEVEHN